MKMRLAAITAMAVAMAAPSNAADIVSLRGMMKFVKKNAACDASVKLSIETPSQYHPGNTIAPGNNDWTGVGMVGDFTAMAWGGSSSDFTTTFQKVSFGTLGETFKGTTSSSDLSTSKVQLRLKALPPTITATDKFVTINGQIKNPFGKSNQATCVVDFTGTYINRMYVAP